MQNDMILRCLAPALALAVVVVGCGDDDAYDDASHRGEGRQLVYAPPIYPTGPYGTTRGSIIAQYQFVGFQNPRLQSNATQSILLADFYNPHADDRSYAQCARHVGGGARG